MAVASDAARSAPRVATRDWTRILSSRWMIVVILAFSFAAYAPTLRDWFTGDDFWFLRASQTHGTAGYIKYSFDFRNAGTSLDFDRYRPLYPIAWRLQYAIFGQHAFGYHAVVVALHLLNVWLVWLIARRLFTEGWQSNLAALIFGLHPAYFASVAWLSGANRAFEATPYFLAMLLWIDFTSRQSTRERAWPAYVGALLSFCVAVLFHSSALTLALVLPVYTFVAAPLRPRVFDLRRSWLPFAPIGGACVIFAAIHLWVQGHSAAEQGYTWGWHQYSNYGAYLGLSLQPLPPDAYSGAVRRILDLGAAASSLVMLAATFAIFAARPPLRIAIFAAAWFYASLLLDSTYTLGAFDRTMYVSGGPLAIALVAVVIWLGGMIPENTRRQAARAAPFVVAVVAVLLVVATCGRTRGTSHASSGNERLAIAAQRDIASMPPGSTLYVTNAPRGTLLFSEDSRLQSMLQLYFGDIHVHAITAAQVAALEPALAPGDRIYRYNP